MKTEARRHGGRGENREDLNWQDESLLTIFVAATTKIVRSDLEMYLHLFSKMILRVLSLFFSLRFKKKRKPRMR